MNIMIKRIGKKSVYVGAGDNSAAGEETGPRTRDGLQTNQDRRTSRIRTGGRRRVITG